MGRLIFNKPQITKEIQEDKNIANVMSVFKKSALPDMSFSMESAWAQ